MVPIDETARRSITDEDEVLLRDVLGQLAGKWPLWTLHVLLDSPTPLRSARLLERVEGISQKMLTQTLRSLERDGLVTRTVYAEVPPRVEYALTENGKEMLVRFKPFWLFIAGRTDEFKTARAQFDARTG
jgi:DNA-binding HxlR family transcriptional regulator